jgi:hypothetical protein
VLLLADLMARLHNMTVASSIMNRSKDAQSSAAVHASDEIFVTGFNSAQPNTAAGAANFVYPARLDKI